MRGHWPFQDAGEARQPHRQEAAPIQWRVRSGIHAAGTERLIAVQHWCSGGLGRGAAYWPAVACGWNHDRAAAERGFAFLVALEVWRGDGAHRHADPTGECERVSNEWEHL